jgi:hypothetical protein
MGMHKAQSRALRASQGRRRGAATLLFLVSCSILAAGDLAAATPPEAASPEITSSLPLPEPPYDQRVFLAKAGAEGFELAARLKENGGLIGRPISWRVYRLLTAPDLGGELVYEGETAIADFLAQPGNYRIDFDYGLARFSRLVTLEPRQRLSLAFNLNIGGLRILSRLAAPASVRFRTSHRIYALSGTDRMRLIAENAIPGDLLRLPAGRYRIESLLMPGNAIARSEIEVKPGMLSAVEIDHEAGIASLALAGAVPVDVTWQILDGAGRVAATASGSASDVILSPGRYLVEVAVGKATLTRSIIISAGKRLEVTFP